MQVKKSEKKRRTAHDIKSYIYDGEKSFILVIKGQKVILMNGDEVTMSNKFMKTNKIKKLLREKEEPKEEEE